MCKHASSKWCAKLCFLEMQLYDFAIGFGSNSMFIASELRTIQGRELATDYMRGV